MKVVVKAKDKSNVKAGITQVVDKHMARTMKRLAKDRSMMRQTDIPDNNM